MILIMSDHTLKELVLVPSCIHPLLCSITWHHCVLAGFRLWVLRDVLDQSVISRRSCSEALDKLRVRRGSVRQHGGQRCCVPVCPPGVSVALCCFSSTRLPLALWTDPPPLPSVRFYFAPRLLLLTVCAFFLSPPRTSLTFSTTSVFLFITPSLSISLFILSFLLLHSATCISPPGLCCAVAAHRSDQDRWSQMISGLFSFLQETAWYCCWHGALSQGVRRSNNTLIHFSFPNSKPKMSSWGGVLTPVKE